MWLWDPSISLDVAFYIVMLTTTFQTGQAPIWQEITTTPGLTYDASNDAPVVGECLIYDIQAEDWAGNRSVR